MNATSRPSCQRHAVTNGRVVVVSFGSEGLYTYDHGRQAALTAGLGILEPGYAGQPELSWGFASSPIIPQTW